MKSIDFRGNSLRTLIGFPDLAKREAGFQLDKVQNGLNPTDWKPMRSIGAGVREIRINSDGQYRVIYIAQFAGKIYVLHAFRKKTQKTNASDIAAAKRAYRQLLEDRK